MGKRLYYKQHRVCSIHTGTTKQRNFGIAGAYIGLKIQGTEFDSPRFHKLLSSGYVSGLKLGKSKLVMILFTRPRRGFEPDRDNKMMV